MDKTKRKAIIAGNWKMNKTPSEAKTLLEAVVPAVKDADCEVIACVPFVDLSVALETTKGSNVKSVPKTATGQRAALSQAKFLLLCSRKWVLSM